MKKNRKRKTYKIGDVVTLRLSPDSNCTQEVVDWINQQEYISSGMIEAIKLQISLENKMSDKIFREIATANQQENESREVYQEERSINIVEKLNIEPETREQSSDNLKEIHEAHNVGMAAEDEIFGNYNSPSQQEVKKPGLRAIRSIQRSRN